MQGETMNNKMLKTITYGAALALAAGAANAAFADDTSCLSCPSGYQSPQGSSNVNQCTITCSPGPDGVGTYVATPNGPCIACPSGKTSSTHTVKAGDTSAAACLAKDGGSTPSAGYKLQ